MGRRSPQSAGSVLSSLTVLVVVILLAAVPGAAQPAFRVADLNTTRTGGTDLWPGYTSFVRLGGAILFGSADGRNGFELWRTDGTAAGTSLVADLCPGSCSSLPIGLTVVGDRAFFTADDGVHGRELWQTDGTAAGTVMVADQVPGAGGSLADQMIELGGALLFTRFDPATGHELWRSDGTAAGTFLLADIAPGPDSSTPIFLARLGSVLLFSAETPAAGRELWRTDGTAAGTTLVKDINPGSGGSIWPSMNVPGSANSAVAAGRLFFSADDGVHGAELWASDGTAAGTALVADSAPGSDSAAPFDLVPFGTGVLFSARSNPSGPQGLWASDGTAAGTVLLKEITFPWHLTPVGSRAFFTGNDGTHGYELWVTDGTPAGTSLVADVNPGNADGIDGLFYSSQLTPFGTGILFFANDGVHGEELWKSDGTAAGTAMVADINPGVDPSYFFVGLSGFDQPLVDGGRFYFRAYTDADGLEVWTSDGTTAGTQKLKEINDQTSSLPGTFGLLLNSLTALDLNGTLLFQADDGVNGAELWRSDGTAAGTLRLTDLGPGAAGSYPKGLTAFGGAALFTADDGAQHYKLWATDGTAAGTGLLADLSASESSANASPFLAQLGGRLLFAGPNGALWATDGTAAGTQLVSGAVQVCGDMARLGSIVVFCGSDAAAGSELWRSDGTAAGTFRVLDLQPGTQSGFPKSSSPFRLTVVNGAVLFQARTDAAGLELWRTDGTAAGTALVADLNPGPGDSLAYSPWVVLGNTLLFAADDGVHGLELWKSDGTAAGTVLVKDLFPGARASDLSNLTVAGNRVFFVADDGVHGRELWMTDGTAAGTVLIQDLVPGSGSALPQQLAASGRVLLFAAFDPDHGVEPWLSDGTPAGTSRLQDVAPGGLSSSPFGFTPSGPYVYFGANDNTTGFEPWAVAKSALGSALSATLTAAGSSGAFYEGGTVTYTLVVTNHGRTLQPDAPGAEVTDVLPAGLALVSASATTGAVTVNAPSRTVTWNGSLLAGAAVTITVQATVQPGTLGTTLTSQASLAWDGDADGVNESTGVSDDPGAAGATDPTAVVIGLQPLEYYTVAPCRVLDTRTGTALAAGVVRTFAVAGSCGVPTTAKAVAVNLTAVNVGGAGSVVVYASGLATPGTSNLNFLPGVNRAGNGLIALSAGGAVDAKAMVMGGGTIDLTLDVFGYFQ